MNDTAAPTSEGDRRQALAADPPPVATREDNRAIHEAIEVAWNVDRDCYLRDGSDLALAKRLDKPRAWVAAVREQFFGPDTCEARLDAAGGLADLERRAKMLEGEAMDVAARAEALGRELAALRRSLGL